MGGKRLAGVISFVLAALSIVVALVNHGLHFIALRSRWFVILFVIFLVIGIVLVMVRGKSSAGSAPPASQ